MVAKHVGKKPAKRGGQRQTVMADDCCWQSSLIDAVAMLLDDESDGHACISTDSGKACQVTIVFTEAGSA